METGSSNSKKILIAGTLAVLAVFCGYYFFFRTPVVTPVFDEFGNPIESQVVGQDLIDLSRELETVTLDANTLKKKTFTNLVDFSVNLPSDPAGRPNPFDPIGSAGASASGGGDGFSDLVNSIINSI
jgi:hypothetical protein